MKIDFKQIKELLKNGNLAEISRETGIAYRTLQDWKLEKNKWLQQAEERLTKLQTYIERDYMGIDKELYRELIHDLEADIANEEVGYDVYVIRDNNQLEYPDQYNPVIDYKSTSQPMIDLDQYGIIIIDFMYAEDLLNELKTELQKYINQEEKKMNGKMKFENLQAVHFDGQHGKGDGYYTLEFNIDGEIEYIEVDEKDHPEAATDEDYFDNKEVVDKIIAENEGSL